MVKQGQALPVIVISQFFCTSLWFAGNAVMPDLVQAYHLTHDAMAHLTSMIQFGFIIGTLTYAVLTIADRFSPSKVFFVSALAGAIINYAIILDGQTMTTLLLFRFGTGFFLAGIYPVGMKIAADYFERGLGKALGYLVGALVLGTAFPHLLKNLTSILPWKSVIITTSILCTIGGLLILIFIPDGPFRKRGVKLNFKAFFNVFSSQNFRSASFGYFGHMWELYAFWAFVPMILATYFKDHEMDKMHNLSLLSFSIIAIGGISCVMGGYFSQNWGSKKTAFIALWLSFTCCVISPLAFYMSFPVLMFFLLFWGMVVIADSPQFSTLVAQSAPSESKGTALTIVNCIGFSITIISIQLLNLLHQMVAPTNIYLFLAIGPLFGLFALRKYGRSV